jgi:hypothetical protein
MRGRKLGFEADGDGGEHGAAARLCGIVADDFPVPGSTLLRKAQYEPFGSLENSPGENVRIFLRKRLSP